MRSSRPARMKRVSDGGYANLDGSKRFKTSTTTRESKMDVSGHDRLVATTTVTMTKGGPISATSIIETQGESSDEEPVTPKNVRKRSCSEPGVIPNAPPQYLIESSWDLPDAKTPVAVRRPSGNPSASAGSVHTMGGTAYLRSMASGGRINQRQHTFSQKTIIKPENCLPCGNRIKFGKSALKCIECRGTCHVDCKSRMPMPCVPTVQTPSNKDFKGTVADYAPSTSPMIPGIVIHCINEIERRGMSEVGIYRINGSEKEIKDMKERLLRGKGQPQISQVDIHVVTGTLKLFFRSLKEPLITYTLWESFVRIADIVDEMDVQTTIYTLVPDLPQPNRDTLAYLILHLQKVAEATACKMPVSNLARMFGPNIVGYSCPDPDPELALRQLKKQHSTMEKLLLIPLDYWRRYVDVEVENFSSTPVSSRHVGVSSVANFASFEAEIKTRLAGFFTGALLLNLLALFKPFEMILECHVQIKTVGSIGEPNTDEGCSTGVVLDTEYKVARRIADGFDGNAWVLVYRTLGKKFSTDPVLQFQHTFCPLGYQPHPASMSLEMVKFQVIIVCFEICFYFSVIMVFLSVFLLCTKTTKSFNTRYGKFIDSVRLHVFGGAGGMGHPKYGGVGGKGGDVIFVANEETTLNRILRDHPERHVKGKEGENSHPHRLVGEKGSDYILPVPIGISVYAHGGAKIGDLNADGDKVVVARGGLGGQPSTQFNGLKGEENKVVLDLKLIADVGLVGFPNAGKSSLLRAISRAKPRVADYPFTTLRPQLGVIQYEDERRISMADLPGLIEGAHRNHGLGYRFLKHIERTKLLVFMVDINGFRLGPKYPHRSPLETLVLLNKELELYGKDVLSKPALLIVNKMDTENAEEKWQKLKVDLGNYEETLTTFPEKIRPTQPVAFDDVWNISVQKDPAAISKLSQRIRHLLDLYDNLASIQTPIRQADQEAHDAKLKNKIKDSLTEHQRISLT
uniref:EOG090X0ACU n=1 Tax=Alona affinis TaxID=381656 RepID=A0A9N6WTU1_9CRUS|nr:EOG090X0ACU [Alona affinis]